MQVLVSKPIALKQGIRPPLANNMQLYGLNIRSSNVFPV